MREGTEPALPLDVLHNASLGGGTSGRAQASDCPIELCTNFGEPAISGDSHQIMGKVAADPPGGDPHINQRRQVPACSPARASAKNILQLTLLAYRPRAAVPGWQPVMAEGDRPPGSPLKDDDDDDVVGAPTHPRLHLPIRSVGCLLRISPRSGP